MLIGSGPAPAALGFRMPAEWEPHAATWIAWPHNRDDWPGKFSPIRWVYTEIVRHLSRVERVHIVVRDDAMKSASPTSSMPSASTSTGSILQGGDRSELAARHRPDLYRQERARLDSDAAVGLIDWKFNGWAKYANHRQTIVSRAKSQVARFSALGTAHRRPEQRHVANRDGRRGDRRQRTRNPARNRGMPAQRDPGPQPRAHRPELEQIFADYLAVSHVIWLGRGIEGDDTHGHVDDLRTFVGPRTVATVVEPRTEDPNHEPLKDNLRRLKDAHDQDGQHLTVVELPMPRPVVFEGQRLPASYANFYIANGVVLVPTFNDPADRVALNTLAELFPDRQVIGIHSVDLVLGLGTLHCLSQQQPAGPTV